LQIPLLKQRNIDFFLNKIYPHKLSLDFESGRDDNIFLRNRSVVQNFCVYNIDALEWLTSLSSGSVDLIITDPPYESLEKHRSIGTTTRLKKSKASSNIWFDIFPNSKFEELLNELYRVLKNNSHLYLFCDQETTFLIKPIAEKVGFKFWKPLIWDKKHIGMGYHYRARYEFILFFEKGKRKLMDLSVPDVLECKKIHRGYPTEKPVGLSEILISQSSAEGDIICDPFMGTASTGRAAIRLGRKFIGADLSQYAYSIAIENLKQEELRKQFGGIDEYT
jgi:site-specific DNA-methyltransferase (adenine-specific)